MKTKLLDYFITQTTLIILQRQHEHENPTNGYPLENLNRNVEKHAFNISVQLLLFLM